MTNFIFTTKGILTYIATLTAITQSITIHTIKGDSDPVAGQPGLALPNTQSCEVTILRAACDSWDKVFEAPFSLPSDCGDPESWSRVILNLQGSVNGVQYDRYGAAWINGIEVLRLTTPEPGSAITSWSLQRDISYTLTYLINNQNALSMYLTIPNNVDSTYTGVFYVTLSFIVYTSDQTWPPITLSTQLVPLTNAVNVNSASPLSPLQVSGNQTLTYTISIEDFKDQVYATDGIHVQIFASAHGCEEFYYSNAPSDYASSLGVCGSGVYREVFVEIDGLFAGAVLPFPVIYTGGINPLLWRPLTGIYSFNIPPYSIDISPFLGLLSDGNHHQLSVSVFNNNPNGYWLLDAAFLLSRSPVVAPTIIPTSLPTPNPSVKPYHAPVVIPSISPRDARVPSTIPSEAPFTAPLFAPSSTASTVSTSSYTENSAKRQMSKPDLFPIPLSQARISSGTVVFYDNTTPIIDVTISKPSTSSIGFHTEGKHWYEIIGVIVTTDGRVITRSTRGVLVLVNQNDFSGETGHTKQLSTGFYASTLFAASSTYKISLHLHICCYNQFLTNVEGAWYEERQLDVYPLDLGEYYSQNNVSMEIKAKLVYSYNRWNGWTKLALKKTEKSNIVENGSLGAEGNIDSSFDFVASETGLHWGNALASNATYSRTLDGSNVLISKDRALEEYHIRDPINYKICYNRFLAALNGKLLLDEVKGNVTTSNCNYPSGTYFCGTDVCGQTPTQGYTAINGYGQYDENQRPLLNAEKVDTSSSSRRREFADSVRTHAHIRRRLTHDTIIDSGANIDSGSESDARSSLGLNIELGRCDYIYLPWSMKTDARVNAPFIKELTRIQVEVAKFYQPPNIDREYDFEVPTRSGLDINEIKLRQAEVRAYNAVKTPSAIESAVDLKEMMQLIRGRIKAFKTVNYVDNGLIQGRNRHTAYAEKLK